MARLTADNMTRFRNALAALAAALCAPTAILPAAAGQLEQQPYGLPIHQLTPVEERVGDVGALSVSLRNVQAGLAVPTGFEQVYRVPGRNDLLVRFDGGVAAVFPESVYISFGKNGIAPVVPPNTVFHIGLLQPNGLAPLDDQFATPSSDTPGAQGPREEPVENVFDFREPLPPGSLAGEASYAAQVPVGPRISYTSRRVEPESDIINRRLDESKGPAIVSDQAYRNDRVRQLLKRAAASHAQPSRK